MMACKFEQGRCKEDGLWMVTTEDEVFGSHNNVFNVILPNFTLSLSKNHQTYSTFEKLDEIFQ